MNKNLQKALETKPKAKAQWLNLTPIARRDFESWINSAKQTETRKHRVKKACSMLASGKRRPCCYSMVPMELYIALNANKKAKAQWKDLTPIGRRNLIDWIGSDKHKIEKACSILEQGRRLP